MGLRWSPVVNPTTQTRIYFHLSGSMHLSITNTKHVYKTKQNATQTKQRQHITKPKRNKTILDTGQILCTYFLSSVGLCCFYYEKRSVLSLDFLITKASSIRPVKKGLAGFGSRKAWQVNTCIFYDNFGPSKPFTTTLGRRNPHILYYTNTGSPVLH